MEKFFFIIFNLFFAVSSQLIVETQYGPIRGAQKLSVYNTTYLSFQKIPYMKAPILTLRFRDPIPPENWTEPLDCTQEGPRFPQVDYTYEQPSAPFRGDLDSMHINVFTKSLNPTVKYPVMVWIFGGGFRTGSPSTEIYGPDYFMERDVILVTFNYRLYAFGFISFDDPELNVPGNAGFKDQVMALKWVKGNIENFGGDSQNITIFGQSSGGGCAHYHAISPASKNLFQRSILMSGSAFNAMYAAIPRRNWAFRLAQMIGYQGQEVDKQILEFLEMVEPQVIFDTSRILMTDYEANVERILNPFGPVIEPYDNGNAFMLEHPFELAKTAWGNDIDIMIGSVSFENGAILPFFFMDPSYAISSLDFPSWVPYYPLKTEEERNTFGEKLKRSYFGDVEPSPLMFEQLILISNDFAFVHGVDLVVAQRIRDSRKNNFVYRFDANADNNCFRDLTLVPEMYHPYRRATHMDELCYLFKPSFVKAPTRGSQSFELMQRMLDIFTNFASTGNPGVENWASSSNPSETLTGLNIRETLNLTTIGKFPEQSHMHIWRKTYGEIFESYNVEDNGLSKINYSLYLTLASFLVAFYFK